MGQRAVICQAENILGKLLRVRYELCVPLASSHSHVHWQQVSEHMGLSNSCPVGITLDIFPERELFFQESSKACRL